MRHTFDYKEGLLTVIKAKLNAEDGKIDPGQACQDKEIKFPNPICLPLLTHFALILKEQLLRELNPHFPTSPKKEARRAHVML